MVKALSEKMQSDCGQKKYSVFIVDDDCAVRDALGFFLLSRRVPYQSYASCAEFIEAYDGQQQGVLILDVQMPDMTGLQLQQHFKKLSLQIPIIFITGHGDIPMAVDAMKHGACDFLRKPIDENTLMQRIAEVFESLDQESLNHQIGECANTQFKKLSKRERQVYLSLVDGNKNREIADELCISERTVEVHRANVMKKLAVSSFAELLKLHSKVEQTLLDASKH